MTAAATELANLSELLNLSWFLPRTVNLFSCVCGGEDQTKNRAILCMLSETSDVMPILTMPLPISSRDLKSPVA